MSESPAGGGPGSFLDFFILEAGEYINQLDALLVGSSPSSVPGMSGRSPDADAMQRAARALRGAATMGKLTAFAELASGVERVGRSLNDGSLSWEYGLQGAVVAAVDDLKILVRNVRNWSPADDDRARARSAELARYAPARPSRVEPAAVSGMSAANAGGDASAGSTSAFLATEASNIAAGLELLTTRSDAETAGAVLRRVRALRGVAGVKEVSGLGDVLEATEDAARGLENGREPLSADGRKLLEAAAARLREIGAALRGAASAPVGSTQTADNAGFAAALERWNTHSDDRERVIPIAQLFYTDGSEGIVETSPNPPTSAGQRFRLEIVSLGEHLRQVLDEARKARDNDSVARAQRDLRKALRALEASAQSFGQREVADFILGHADATAHLDFLGLSALDDLAAVLADPGADGERLIGRLRDVADRRELSSAIGSGFGDADPAAQAAAQASATSPDRLSGVTRSSVATPSPLSVETPAFAAQAQTVRSEMPESPAASRMVDTPPFDTPGFDTPAFDAPAIHESAIESPPSSYERAPAPETEPALTSEAAPGSSAEPAHAQLPDIESLDYESAAAITSTTAALDHAQAAQAASAAPGAAARSTAAAEPPPPPPDHPSVSMIDSTIAAIDAFDGARFAPRTALPEEEIVGIETLLYRGRSALDRALELREAVRRSAAAGDHAPLDELFDLLELARAD